MSEPEKPGENFLSRWSRLKQATGTGASAGTEPPQPEDAESDALPEVDPQRDPPAFDPSSLPPIDSITAASDIRAFLAPGVPEELSRAALRRAWVIDPTIRDFIGIAENQWDFTRLDDVPGFGSLEVTAELRTMVAQLVGSMPARAARPPQAADNPPEPPHQEGEQEAEAEQEDKVLEATRGLGAAHNAAEPPSNCLQTDAAAQKEPLDTTRASGAARRRHGGALPR
jgi:hypothetical protein